MSRSSIISDAMEIDERGAQGLSDYAESSKFDGQDHADKLLLAACSIIQLEGMADEELGSTDEFGFFWRVENVVCCEDSNGFIGGAEFSAPCWADHKMRKIEEELSEDRKPYVKETIR